MRGEVARVDAQAGSAHEPLQQRRLRDQATFVVQRATHHEAQSVRVARRRSRACAARRVPHVERGHVGGARSAASTSAASVDVGRRSGRLVALDLDRVPGGARSVVGHDRQVARCAARSRRRARGIGSTTPSRARFERASAVTPANAGATRAISSVTSSTVARSRSRPSRQRELGRDAPVVHRGALGRDLAADALHAAFEVGDRAGLLAPERARQEHVGALRRLRVERVDRDDRVDRVERRAARASRRGSR